MRLLATLIQHSSQKACTQNRSSRFQQLVCGLAPSQRPTVAISAHTLHLQITPRQSLCCLPAGTAYLPAHRSVLCVDDTSNWVMCSLPGGADCCSCSRPADGFRTPATTVLPFSSSCLANSRPMPCDKSVYGHFSAWLPLSTPTVCQLCNNSKHVGHASCHSGDSSRLETKHPAAGILMDNAV